MTAAGWIEGSFLDNFTSAASALGFENLGVAWGLAGIPWESKEDRDGVLNALTQVPWGQVVSAGGP
jgi:hypothetical protein